jgi:hypothetical protein
MRIPPAEFRDLILGLGGHISSEDPLEGGVTRPDGAVWFYDGRSGLERDVVDAERRILEKLGGIARARVAFELSSDPASQQVMLEIAAELTRRWPAVLQCATHRVMTLPLPPEVMVAGPQDEEKLILGPELRLYFTTDVQARLLRSIAALDRVTLCAPHGGATAPTAQTLMMSNISGLAPEDVMGWIEAEGGMVWLSYVFDVEPEAEEGALARHVSTAVRERLGKVARCFSELAIGYGASRATEALCLRLAQRILEDSPGVVVGMFNSVLDVDAVRRLASAGRGFVD